MNFVLINYIFQLLIKNIPEKLLINCLKIFVGYLISIAKKKTTFST